MRIVKKFKGILTSQDKDTFLLSLSSDLFGQESDLVIEYKSDGKVTNFSGSKLPDEIFSLLGTHIRDGFFKMAKSKIEDKETLYLLLEATRLSHQVENADPSLYKEFLDGIEKGPFVFKNFEIKIWPELEESCSPYAKKNEFLLKKDSFCQLPREKFYFFKKGERFRREKLFVIEKFSDLFTVTTRMDDDAHSFSITFIFKKDLYLVSVISSSRKLPYPYLCDLPKKRLEDLLGMDIRDEKETIKKVRNILGGAFGCHHLVDLTLDSFSFLKENLSRFSN